MAITNFLLQFQSFCVLKTLKVLITSKWTEKKEFFSAFENHICFFVQGSSQSISGDFLVYRNGQTLETTHSLETAHSQE